MTDRDGPSDLEHVGSDMAKVGAAIVELYANCIVPSGNLFLCSLGIPGAC